MSPDHPRPATLPLTPLPVSEPDVADLRIDLNGRWDFHPGPEDGFWENVGTNGWGAIEVPSEWVMQGFDVKEGASAGFRRKFVLPESWRGKRVKLRCDGIYSDATIWINGKRAGAHLGGFTAFELDVTDVVQSGGNAIAISVRSDSIADKLASGMKYATHDLGGITRKIFLFAVPEMHIADLYVWTVFDQYYRDAKLMAQVQVENQSAQRVDLTEITLSLRDGAHEVRSATAHFAAFEPGAVAMQEFTMEVEAPHQWDSEHPYLYDLVCTMKCGDVKEAVARRVGFRQVEVRQNQVYVNNHPVKLRGVNRHETDPLRGRSLVGDTWRKDAELFRAMNCNLIRTSHYPPPEEFLHICDELGLFVELEAPFCWAFGNDAPEALDYTIQAEIETVLRDRSHPCIIMWSLANESLPWGKNFEIAYRDHLKALDGSRPFFFEINSENLTDNPPLDIDALHYPGFVGPDLVADHPRPVLFGEFAHLNTYNRSELLTDPGLRDVWGLGVAEMWERMLASRGCLGGAIWAAIDDLFLLPSGASVGYGEWGPLDAWRRPRPEYWHLKKTFSPVRIQSISAPPNGKSIQLTVENRHYFSDLEEVRFEWSLGAECGGAKTNAKPGATGTLVIPVEVIDGQTLELRAIDLQGFLLDEWRFSIGATRRGERPVHPGKASFSEEEGVIRIVAGTTHYEIDDTTGMIASAASGGVTIPLHGPWLMVLPLKPDQDGKVSQFEFTTFNPTCTDWHAEKVSVREDGESVELRIAGEYTEASGEFVIGFSGDGMVRVEYDFALKAEVSPRQIGLVFVLPPEFDTLKWRREAQWSFYPDDHIGRPEGEAIAFPTDPLFAYRSAPTWSWAHDCTPGGSNDFRSTKRNVLEASLRTQRGHELHVRSEGQQHVRAWVEGDATHLLIADFDNEGAASYFKEHVLPRPTFQPGEHVKGAVTIELGSRS